MLSPGVQDPLVAIEVLEGPHHSAPLLLRGLFGEADTPLYLAAALIGAVYIWWSALQAIRERDFTADIPVSVATAAIAIHQYSAAAVVASSSALANLLPPTKSVSQN